MEDGSRLAGPAYLLEWQHFGNHFVSKSQYTDRSPNFRSQLGYFDRLDMRQVSHIAGYYWRPERGIVQSFGPRFSVGINYNRQGRLRDWYGQAMLQIAMVRSTQISIWSEELFELYQNIGFRQHLNGFNFSSEWLKWFGVTGAFSNGLSINYRPGQGLDPFLGKRLHGRAGLTFRPTPRLRLDETYIYSGLQTRSGFDLAGEAGNSMSVFNNHIVRSTANYHYSRQLSLRFIADYNSVLPNSTLMAAEKEKTYWPGRIIYLYAESGYGAAHRLYGSLRQSKTQSTGVARPVSHKFSQPEHWPASIHKVELPVPLLKTGEPGMIKLHAKEIQ